MYKADVRRKQICVHLYHIVGTDSTPLGIVRSNNVSQVSYSVCEKFAVLLS